MLFTKGEPRHRLWLLCDLKHTVRRSQIPYFDDSGIIPRHQCLVIQEAHFGNGLLVGFLLNVDYFSTAVNKAQSFIFAARGQY